MIGEECIEWDEDPLEFVFQDEIPGKVKMHVKRLDLRNWVRIDKTYPFQMAERMKLYETNMADIFVTNFDTKTKSCKWEFFETLIEHLLFRFPQIFERKGSFIYNRVTKMSVSTEADYPEDPLLRAGKLTQEDWIILQYDQDQLGYVLIAGLLCFPMNWELTEKFNRAMPDIHEPVKLYRTHLKEKVGELFLKMTPKNPYWRSNWGIYPGLKGPYDLFIHPSNTVSEEKKEFPFEGYDTGRKIFLRCELQTLRKFPNSGCIVFGIHTYQRYLHELRDLPIEVSKSLRSTIMNTHEEYLDYKGGSVWKSSTLQYLDLIISDRNQEVSNVAANKYFSFWFLRVTMFVGVATVSLFLRKTIFRR